MVCSKAAKVEDIYDREAGAGQLGTICSWQYNFRRLTTPHSVLTVQLYQIMLCNFASSDCDFFLRRGTCRAASAAAPRQAITAQHFSRWRVNDGDKTACWPARPASTICAINLSTFVATMATFAHRGRATGASHYCMSNVVIAAISLLHGQHLFP